MKSNKAMIPRSYERNFSNCVERPEKFRTPLKARPEFFRLLHAIAKIAFITARTIASFELSFKVDEKLRHVSARALYYQKEPCKPKSE